MQREAPQATSQGRCVALHRGGDYEAAYGCFAAYAADLANVTEACASAQFLDAEMDVDPAAYGLYSGGGGGGGGGGIAGGGASSSGGSGSEQQLTAARADARARADACENWRA